MTRLELDPSTLFSKGTSVASPTVRQLMAWREHRGEGALLLPPIQRSLVWRNAQIVNYWDSLLRGYPPGLFMVHRVGEAKGSAAEQGSDGDGKLQDVRDADWQLFDGQQRVSALLLGRGAGQLANSLRLWIDLGVEPDGGELRFALRVSSTGQPFGYRIGEPNRKFELSEREDWWTVHDKRGFDRAEAFGGEGPEFLLRAICCIPLAEAITEVEKGGEEALAGRPGAKDAVAREFGAALLEALDAETIVKRIDSNIVGKPDEYVRFFGRIGQGGTALTDDELTYSLIKQRFPHVRDRMREIAEDESAGRLAGAVDLVLGAMRVARVQLRRGERDHGGTGRPDPRFVSRLEKEDALEEPFLALLPREQPTSGTVGSHLGAALAQVRATLEYKPEHNPGGMPVMLLARMPSELVDMLVLFAVLGGDAWDKADREALRAFVLHSMLFVDDHCKAANQAFSMAIDSDWTFGAETARDLVSIYEREGIARIVPREDVLDDLRQEAAARTNDLRPWADRFKAADTDDRHGTEALRVLATNRWCTKNALLWLQRAYIHEAFPNYDPTSGRDEDMPLDLDHIVPHDLFGFDWRHREKRLAKNNDLDNFQQERAGIGNSLGNFRWLCGRTNRSRGKSRIEVDGSETERFDLIENIAEWNDLIAENPSDQNWTREDVGKFHRLIESRTVALYETILREGIKPALPAGGSPDQQP